MAAPVAQYVQEGESVDYTPVSDVAAGTVVDLGTLVGIATLDIAAGRMGALVVDGTWAVDKYAGEAIALGAPVYWDDGTKTATGTVAYSEALMGFCARAAVAGDAKVRVRLCPGAGLPTS